LINSLRATAAELGFDWCGVAPAIDSGGFSDLVRWIESGYAGEMSYIPDRLDAYRHPRGVLEGVRSIIVLATPYDAGQPSQHSHSQQKGDQTNGRIARYAWSGTDYHDVIHPKLKQLCRQIRRHIPDSKSRGIVDTAPLMEREVAQLAGFGWRGKNTLLLNKHLGSYFFLSCLLTDVALPIDNPHQSAHCGTCTACLDACPTDAFPSAGVLDATRCISYLTIEHRGAIPVDLREGIGDWLFGCDVCQEVCPWNTKRSRQTPITAEPFEGLELRELFELDDDQFRQRFRKTPMWRTRRRGILRNAAIVLGNSGSADHLDALNKGLWDTESIVRGASAWAIGRCDDGQASSYLASRLKVESDDQVRSEIEAAMLVSRNPFQGTP
jgi:epoxyqueuosine reductase